MFTLKFECCGFRKQTSQFLIHEFSDEKRNILPRARRVRGLINLHRLAKNMLTKQLALHPHMGPVEKKVKGNLPKKSKISWQPLPSTSQDYSSSSDLEIFEDDEASSRTWTIVERKLLNHHVLPTGWLSWLSTGLPCGRSWVRTPAGPTLRVFK